MITSANMVSDKHPGSNSQQQILHNRLKLGAYRTRIFQGNFLVFAEVVLTVAESAIMVNKKVILFWRSNASPQNEVSLIGSTGNNINTISCSPISTDLTTTLTDRGFFLSLNIPPITTSIR